MTRIALFAIFITMFSTMGHAQPNGHGKDVTTDNASRSAMTVSSTHP